MVLLPKINIDDNTFFQKFNWWAKVTSLVVVTLAHLW